MRANPVAEPSNDTERRIAVWDRKNPHLDRPMSREFATHEIDTARQLQHFLILRIATDARYIFAYRAVHSQSIMGEPSTVFPSRDPLTIADFSVAEVSLLGALACARILKLWHGPSSAIANRHLYSVERRVDERLARCAPNLFDNGIISIAWVLATESDHLHLGVRAFAPVGTRGFLTTDSPMLDNFTMVHAFLGHGTNASTVLPYASQRVRSHLLFMESMVAWLGKEGVESTHPVLLQNQYTSIALRVAYSTYCRGVPLHVYPSNELPYVIGCPTFDKIANQVIRPHVTNINTWCG